MKRENGILREGKMGDAVVSFAKEGHGSGRMRPCCEVVFATIRTGSRGGQLVEGV